MTDLVVRIAAGVALAAVVFARIASDGREIAELKRDLVEQRSAYESAALEQAHKISDLGQQLLTERNELEVKYVEDTEALRRQRDAESADADRLRQQLKAATARRGAGVEATAADCQRAADQHAELGELAGEGVELLVEGQAILRERDRDVHRLLNELTLQQRIVNQAAE